MKKKYKILIIIAIAIVVIVGSSIVYKIFSDESRLSIKERNWIDNNISNIQNVNVLNDNDVFGKNGVGVYFDLLKNISDEYEIEFNPIAISKNDKTSGITFGCSNTYSDNDKVIYEDHYIIISKDYELIKSYDDLKGKDIAITSDNLSYVSSYLKNVNINFKQYLSRKELETAFTAGEEQYILVPRIEYLDFVLTNNLYIIEHLSDIPVYYLLKDYKSSELGTIINKYLINWKEEFEKSFDEAEFNMFTSKLGISETEVDALRSMDYDYGFVNTSPYEVISGGNYGGIVAMYLNGFSNFADIDINFTKYNSLNKFYKAIENGEIDFYFNYYNLNNNYKTINAEMPIEYTIVAKNNNHLVVNSFNSLANETVYVLKDSILKNYLTSIPNIKIKTYENTKELFKLAKKDVIIILDKNIFEYYKTSELKDYSSRLIGYVDSEYTFKMNNSNAFYKLFNKYVSTIDYNEMVNKGIYNHYETIKSGSLLGKLAKYFLIVLFLSAIVIYIAYRRTKKITIIKKIKREDKMKYIDQLTSLKNRNYLNENIENWNNNKIYPQTMIVIDLNDIQHINDTLGYDEGDKQIKALANILIKTQLDYSDVMRTDGNEFLIYLVGYTQKQITSYIHKLNKEIKKLPYEYGAEFGYSMITDDIKTVEDAINEAVEEMKAQKKGASQNGKDEEKN